MTIFFYFIYFINRVYLHSKSVLMCLHYIWQKRINFVIKFMVILADSESLTYRHDILFEQNVRIGMTI